MATWRSRNPARKRKSPKVPATKPELTPTEKTRLANQVLTRACPFCQFLMPEEMVMLAKLQAAMQDAGAAYPAGKMELYGN
jgi:hypothetical protein